MCRAGDIIVISNYKHKNIEINKHSFVVLDDEAGEIQGLDYDFVANVMSSFKNQEQKKWKLSKYPQNFKIEISDRITNPDNKKEGYIKADQFYYFSKENIEYQVIGAMTESKFRELIEFINNLEIDFEDIIDNL